MSLDFGVVLQTDPPAQRVIDLAKRAEAYGFSHAWTFDSHLLWEEPFVIYSRILAIPCRGIDISHRQWHLARCACRTRCS